jgi:hypothetical protein
MPKVKAAASKLRKGICPILSICFSLYTPTVLFVQTLPQFSENVERTTDLLSQHASQNYPLWWEALTVGSPLIFPSGYSIEHQHVLQFLGSSCQKYYLLL